MEATPWTEGAAAVATLEGTSPSVVATPSSSSPRGKWARSQEFRKFLFATFECLQQYAKCCENEMEVDVEFEEASEGVSTTKPEISAPSATTCDTPKNNSIPTVNDYYTPYVLDVAGGKGDVAIPLRIRGVRCGIVDPRVVDLANTKLMRNVNFHLGRSGTKTGDAMRKRLLQQHLREERYRQRNTGCTESSNGGSSDMAAPEHEGFSEKSVQVPLPTVTSVTLPDIFREWFTSENETDRGRAEAAATEAATFAEIESTPCTAAIPRAESIMCADKTAQVLATGDAAPAIAAATAEEEAADEDAPESNITGVGCRSRKARRRARAAAAAAGSTPSVVGGRSNPAAPIFRDSPALRQTKRDCDVIVGMHPDQATEPIVDFALATRKPFAIVPCCVFARENPHRRLRVEVDDSEEESSLYANASAVEEGVDTAVLAASEEDGRPRKRRVISVPVETYEQYLDYLQQKAPVGVIKRTTLPIEGRNVVLYCSKYE